ncbi:alcohol dehydrogenase catalytic domain-containing protein [Nocardiopsis changdeensis]|uniref:Alcohol dehydrogenase catalytic domain-containing protein n=1 Tax=Nocardiopsis changdeensis TaxID=2831969 RepID=A0ABX8BDP0_9ACTN|nr:MULTISPECIES: alcohol dehydrogenase catalytic domain-containing protein [Nocardiopsis]QUX20276.1 alcohol dehydrogenase catalytic domain-containing protein [Nocardiopsis changdeensis]QYX36206.1 alcohol dehydrogenase catalytic domain-containing protein [Nocardiopsis sp. MT53]
MKAVVWNGTRDVRAETVPDPRIEEPADVILRVGSSGLCGSDLHLYEVLGPFMHEGDILGHEALGTVEETGPGVTSLAPGDRVVIPFQISCGHCAMCESGLQTQCETTRDDGQGTGAPIYGYSSLYGSVPGAQAEHLRVPRAEANAIPVPAQGPDERYLYLSDVLPTAWQAVRYADVPPDGSVAVLGLGPIGDMCCRVARHLGAGRVFGVDPVPERRARAAARGAEVFDPSDGTDGLIGEIRERTRGQGPDAVIDAVGLEAQGHGSARLAQRLTSFLPKGAAAKLMETAGVDRLAALQTAIELVRRGGTVSVIGVYGGTADPLPMLTMFDKQIQLRMGQANVRRWAPDILPLLDDRDVLGVEDFATHRVALDDAADAYAMFQAKRDGAVKVVFRP